MSNVKNIMAIRRAHEYNITLHSGSNFTLLSAATLKQALYIIKGMTKTLKKNESIYLEIVWNLPTTTMGIEYRIEKIRGKIYRDQWQSWVGRPINEKVERKVV